MRFPCGVSCGLVVAVLLGYGGLVTQAETPAEKLMKDDFVDVLGNKFRLAGPDDCKAVVLLFVGYDCPISNGYTPEVLRLCKEYTPKKVAFCVVYAEADITKDDARKHAKEYGYTCPAILDPEMKLARKVGATVKPEAAVLSPKGELLYRGRINDLYIDFGKKRPQATTHDLKNALDAVLTGKAIPIARTKAVGCYIDFTDKKK
jgi:thiol-disulfide isomerase/thioredoxin